MRFLALTLFGIYQLGRSSRQQDRFTLQGIGRELFTIPESVETSGDAVEKFQADGSLSARWKEIALKQHMELLGIPGEYIHACFVAMMGEPKAESFLSHNKRKLSPWSDARWSFAKKLLFLKQRYMEEFDPCFTAIAGQNLLKFKRAIKTLHIPAKYMEVCFAAIGLEAGTVGHVMRIPGVEPIPDLAERFNLDEKLMQLRRDYADDAALVPCLDAMEAKYVHESALELKRLQLKQQMEWLNVPREYIRACFVTLMGEGEAGHFMTSNPAIEPMEAKWTFEEKLWSLKFWFTDAESVACFDAMEKKHKATETINRVVQRFIAAKQIAKVEADPKASRKIVPAQPGQTV